MLLKPLKKRVMSKKAMLLFLLLVFRLYAPVIPTCSKQLLSASIKNCIQKKPRSLSYDFEDKDLFFDLFCYLFHNFISHISFL